MGDLRTIREDNVVYTPCNFEFDRCGLGRFVFNKMKEHAGDIFQLDAATGATQTYKATNRKIVKVALEMKNRGIGTDDVVVVCASNSVDVVLPIFATLYLNAITASLDKMVPARNVTYLLDIVKPKMIFVEEASLKLIEDSLGDNVDDVEIVVMGETDEWAHFCKVFKGDEVGSFVPGEVDDQKTAVILFSSGTTGMPKPMCCSHYALMYSVMGMWSTGLDCRVTMHFNSFYWISAIVMTLMTLLVGGKKVVVSAFHPVRALEYLENYQVTFAFMNTNFAYTFSLEMVGNYDTSSLHTLMFGGSPMGKGEMARCKSYFPGALVTMIYGQTEVCGPITTFNTMFSGDDKPNSCGLPIPGMHIKVVDPATNIALGPNEVGEVCVLTKAIVNGYYNVDSSELVVDSDGYLKTGDLGYIDDDNSLYVSDRIKEMFKYKNWHIVPASIENVIREHEAVLEVVVVGISHPIDGEHPMAIVVLKEDCAGVTGAEIEAFVNERVLDWEQLRAGVRIVEEIPKTSTGKINRKEIRDMVRSGKF